ncbi:hypothetical protein DPMN_084318 [Dreissena polymorpha]|uniref:Uncharacterized protein n=1 Tax=Dreissena polymorpha TaxID=45954 RepID=A0A9D3YAB8_DREPO|nr:hypothetical protein DPMN_084318 [Dreissena polymorpha]
MLNGYSVGKTQGARLRQLVMLLLQQFVNKLSLHQYKWDLFKSIIYIVRMYLSTAADFVENDILGSDTDWLKMSSVPPIVLITILSPLTANVLFMGWVSIHL